MLSVDEILKESDGQTHHPLWPNLTLRQTITYSLYDMNLMINWASICAYSSTMWLNGNSSGPLWFGQMQISGVVNNYAAVSQSKHNSTAGSQILKINKLCLSSFRQKHIINKTGWWQFQ